MTSPPTSEVPYVRQELSQHVLWLTLNRPAHRNPLSSHMIAALHKAIDDAGSDPRVRVVVIAATGPVFCAGHDLREMAANPGKNTEAREAHLRKILSACAAMMTTIMHSPKAVIGCVQGTATAAGCQLVSACDLALSSSEARFCTPGVNIGTFCTTPLVGIARNTHRKHAMELALTGDMFSAEDALRFGLVNRVVAAEELHDEVAKLASKIASKSAQGIRAGKEAFYRQVDMPLEQAFAYATEEMIRATLSEDAREGTQAFIEKREPKWSDV
jgi:enoyl-CoA hydratase/carnithine racemase